MARETRAITLEVIMRTVFGAGDAPQLAELRKVLGTITHVTFIRSLWYVAPVLGLVPPWRGYARAIREVIEDKAVDDREELRAVAAPTLLLCLEGDPIHPAELGRILAGVMPNTELITYESPEAMLEAVPILIAKVSDFLAAT